MPIISYSDSFWQTWTFHKVIWPPFIIRGVGGFFFNRFTHLLLTGWDGLCTRAGVLLF